MADQSEIASKLDILIRLQATSLVENFNSQREKIEFLSRVGFAPKLIGEILGTSANSVSVTISKMKKSGGGNGEGKG